MKRKEIADLIRSYRNNNTLSVKTTYYTAGHQLISLVFTGCFSLPDESKAVNMCLLDGSNSTSITFAIKINNNKNESK